MKKHKYLASFPSDRWARLERDAKRRGVSYNVVINDALDDSHMRSLFGSGLFEDSISWHNCKVDTPETNKLLILGSFKEEVMNYYIGTYNDVSKNYYAVNSTIVRVPDYWMYLPVLKI